MYKVSGEYKVSQIKTQEKLFTDYIHVAIQNTSP